MCAQGGDCYVSNISTGGQYLASYQFHATSEEEKESIKNDAEGEVKGFGADAKFSLSTAVSDISSKHNMSVQFSQAAIGLSQQDLPDPSKVVDFALTFGAKALDHAEVLNFSVQSYSTLDDCPDDIRQLDEYRDSYLGFLAIQAWPLLRIERSKPSQRSARLGISMSTIGVSLLSPPLMKRRRNVMIL
jgi:hypothetical protein